MDKEVKLIYDTMCETNDDLIKTGKPVKPIVVFIKNGDKTLHNLKITKVNKKKVINDVKDLAKYDGIDAYIIIYNARTYTDYKLEDKETEVEDCIIRSVYTPKEAINELVYCKGINIISKERIIGRQFVDVWDAWPPEIIIGIRIPEPKSKKVKEPCIDIERFKYKVKKR